MLLFEDAFIKSCNITEISKWSKTSKFVSTHSKKKRKEKKMVVKAKKNEIYTNLSCDSRVS